MDTNKINDLRSKQQILVDVLERIKGFENDPEQLVQIYVANMYTGALLSTERFANEYLTKNKLLQFSQDDRFKAFYWLLNKKYSSIDNENFEYAAAVKDSLSDLEDILYPYKRAEVYRAMVDFLKAEQGLQNSEIESKYEQFLIGVFDANISASGKMELDYMDVQTIMLPIKFIEECFGKTREFTEYFVNRDSLTVDVHRLYSRKTV